MKFFKLCKNLKAEGGYCKNQKNKKILCKFFDIKCFEIFKNRMTKNTGESRRGTDKGGQRCR